MSAEIELNHVGAPPDGAVSMMDVVKKWNSAVVSDSSVLACEINTAPANGDLWAKQINELCEAMARQGAQIGVQCGLHVHVDARDYNFYDIRRLVYLYRHVEDALFSIVHPVRRESRFSVPCSHKFINNIEKSRLPKEAKKNFFLNVYGQAPNQHLNRASLSTQKYNDSRYNALNLHSWMYRGTVENRMHQGTVDATKIINWGLLNAAMLDYAYNNSESHIKGMAELPPPEVLRAPTKARLKQSVGVLIEICPDKYLKDWVEKRFNEVPKKKAADTPVDP